MEKNSQENTHYHKSLHDSLPTSISIERPNEDRTKEIKKEEGKRRAKAIAIHRAQFQQKRNTSTRHGSRNQNRHQKLTKWLIQKFPHILNDQHVLDVAGGKGELAARLVFCHNVSVIMVDPRKANVRKCYEDVVFKTLPKKHQEAYQAKLDNGEEYKMDKKVQRKFQQLITTFHEDKVDSNHTESIQLTNAVKNASLLIGMHADGATEAIVNVALKYSKPFVVVPCCVFPNLFVHRTLTDENGNIIKVRTHEQFCTYLLQKCDHFVMETLPFDGRNVAIYWNGQRN